ncbi:uncharacterized protein LOC129327727 [Eublepharis macularius]|uniref:Uncharacterized protein LOC129327727 n=1 Tax=Eublepharis macularius TaxID=481883 RepID=A0AA97KVF1_EUBMA|nr:uncharacterized protein LOC129327727 [Eublepharis macularius]
MMSSCSDSGANARRVAGAVCGSRPRSARWPGRLPSLTCGCWACPGVCGGGGGGGGGSAGLAGSGTACASATSTPSGALAPLRPCGAWAPRLMASTVAPALREIDTLKSKIMNRILLYGIPILLFCAMAQGLWCFHHCKLPSSDNACIPVACYACKQDQCYYEDSVLLEVTPMPQKRRRPRLGMSNVTVYNHMYWQPGCTTAENRHLCNTTRDISSFEMMGKIFTRRSTFSCCSKMWCNTNKTLNW